MGIFELEYWLGKGASCPLMLWLELCEEMRGILGCNDLACCKNDVFIRSKDTNITMSAKKEMVIQTVTDENEMCMV